MKSQSPKSPKSPKSPTHLKNQSVSTPSLPTRTIITPSDQHVVSSEQSHVEINSSIPLTTTLINSATTCNSTIGAIDDLLPMTEETKILLNLRAKQLTEFRTCFNQETRQLPIIPPYETLPKLKNPNIKNLTHDNYLYDRVRVDQTYKYYSGQERLVHRHENVNHCHCCENTSQFVRVWRGNNISSSDSNNNTSNTTVTASASGTESSNQVDCTNYQPIMSMLHEPSKYSDSDHPFTLYDRILHPESAPVKPYYSTRRDFRSTIHWGQRKLLLSEIEFLTLYAPTADHYGSSKQIYCVYAGAAPGNHITILSDLFPHVKFILVDPNPFASKLADYPDRIECINGYFTNEMARHYQSSNHTDKVFLFLCDIRSADPNNQQFEEHEEWVKKDMDLQMNWITLMKPRFSMIKFRLPYTEKKDLTKHSHYTLYLDGLIYLPVWGRQATTETRLLIDGEKLRLKWYDNLQYEQQLFYFNRVTRISFFPHTLTNIDQIDYCYDCRSELFILEQYLNSIQSTNCNNSIQVGVGDESLHTTINSTITNYSNIRNLKLYSIKQLFSIISNYLSTGRDLTQIIKSEEFKFSKVKHLEHSQQSDRAKLEERNSKLTEENSKKRKHDENYIPSKKR